MKIDFDGTEYDLDFDEITLKQAKAIKDNCGVTLTGLENGINEGDPDALRALFWLMQVNSGIKSDINNIDFKIVQFSKAIEDAALEQAKEDAAKAKAEKASANVKRQAKSVKVSTEAV